MNQSKWLWALACAGSLAACGNNNNTDASAPADTGVSTTDAIASETGPLPDNDGSTGDTGPITATDGGIGGDTATPPRCEPGGGAPCFVPPTDVMQAVGSGDAGLIAPDFSCAQPEMYTAPTAVTASGSVTDFQLGTPIANATISLFADDDFAATPIAMATSDVTGNYTLTIPAGTPNILNWRTHASAALDTFGTHQIENLHNATLHSDRQSVGNSTAAGIAALTGRPRTGGTGVVAGEAMDCHGRSIVNAIATLSSTSSTAAGATPTFVSGAVPYYFAGGNGVDPLPTSRANQRMTAHNTGLFVILDIPPTSGNDHDYIQVWGFRTAADVARGTAGLTLVSEIPTRVLADSVLAPEMTALTLP